MKKLLFIPVTLFAFAVYAQPKPKPKVHNQSKVKELPDSPAVYQTTKYKDKVDDRLKGPNGEKIYVNPYGVRYFMKGTQKVYVPNEPNKIPPELYIKNSVKLYNNCLILFKMPDTNKPIGYLVKQVDQLLTEGINKIQQAAGLTRGSWQVLHSVSEKGVIKKDDLALLMKPFANATDVETLLHEFIKKKILQTGAGEIYQLTEKGKHLHEQCLQQQTAFRQKVITGIAPEQYATTLYTLETIINNLSK